MATKKTDKEIITIKTPNIIKTNITLVGDTPLIVHAWGRFVTHRFVSLA